MNDDDIEKRLKTAAENGNKAFAEKLIFTKYPMTGAKAGDIRRLANEIAKEPGGYFDTARLDTYEHILLYGLALAAAKLPLNKTLGYLEPLTALFDNWGHVDTVISAFAKRFSRPVENAAALEFFKKTADRGGEFEVRCLVIFLMDCRFNDTAQAVESLNITADLEQGRYYVDMAIAWALSVALVYHYDAALGFLTRRAFSKFVHNKAIQKARESFRITPERKEHLNSLKIK
ncbi:MAG: DNA alkylation repair protein [Clostridiales bacterium]|jgi:3-methyladenine DNA glycosylase AlkD|nr:DNA alkylation repair protein [Clostridiales bacterium]